MKSQKSYLKFFLIISLLQFSFFLISPAFSLDLVEVVSDCLSAVDFKKLERLKRKHVMDKKTAENCFERFRNSSNFNQFNNQTDCQNRFNERFFNELKNLERKTKWSFFHDNNFFDAVTKYVKDNFKSNIDPTNQIESLGGKLRSGGAYLNGEIITYEVPINNGTLVKFGLKNQNYTFGVISRDNMEILEVKKIKLEFHKVTENGVSTYKLISVYPQP